MRVTGAGHTSEQAAGLSRGVSSDNGCYLNRVQPYGTGGFPYTRVSARPTQGTRDMSTTVSDLARTEHESCYIPRKAQGKRRHRA
jgi:hypothetical protein